MPLPLLFAALAGIQGAKGIADMFSSQNQLDDLHKKPFPLQSETPEQKQLRLEAMDRRNQGFTPAQTSAYQQQLARSENTGYQRTMNVAPGLAGAALAGINYTNTGAVGDFATRDAQQQKENFKTASGFVNQLQSISNNNIAAQQRNRIMAEQSLGRSVADSRDRAMSAGNTLIAGQSYGQQDNFNSQYLKALQGLNVLGKPNAPAPSLNAAPSGNGFPYQEPQTTDWVNTGGYK